MNSIQTCLAKKSPVAPVCDMPKTLIAKGVVKEGGLGIHVPRITVTPVFDMPETPITKDGLKEDTVEGYAVAMRKLAQCPQRPSC